MLSLPWQLRKSEKNASENASENAENAAENAENASGKNAAVNAEKLSLALLKSQCNSDGADVVERGLLSNSQATTQTQAAVTAKKKAGTNAAKKKAKELAEKNAAENGAENAEKSGKNDDEIAEKSAGTNDKNAEESGKNGAENAEKNAEEFAERNAAEIDENSRTNAEHVKEEDEDDSDEDDTYAKGIEALFAGYNPTLKGMKQILTEVMKLLARSMRDVGSSSRRSRLRDNVLSQQIGLLNEQVAVLGKAQVTMRMNLNKVAEKVYGDPD